MKYKIATPVEVPGSSRIPEGATKWVQIGTAWSDFKDGKITCALSALPFRSEYIYLFPVDETKEGE